MSSDLQPPRRERSVRASSLATQRQLRRPTIKPPWHGPRHIARGNHTSTSRNFATRAYIEAQPLDIVANAMAPAVALGYAIGRIGCQLAGDGDYGNEDDDEHEYEYGYEHEYDDDDEYEYDDTYEY